MKSNTKQTWKSPPELAWKEEELKHDALFRRYCAGGASAKLMTLSRCQKEEMVGAESKVKKYNTALKFFDFLR